MNKLLCILLLIYVSLVGVNAQQTQQLYTTYLNPETNVLYLIPYPYTGSGIISYSLNNTSYTNPYVYAYYNSAPSYYYGNYGYGYYGLLNGAYYNRGYHFSPYGYGGFYGNNGYRGGYNGYRGVYYRGGFRR